MADEKVEPWTCPHCGEKVSAVMSQSADTKPSAGHADGMIVGKDGQPGWNMRCPKCEKVTVVDGNGMPVVSDGE